MSLMRFHPLNTLLVGVITVENKYHQLRPSIYLRRRTRMNRCANQSKVCWLLRSCAPITRNEMWMCCRMGTSFISLKESFPRRPMPAGSGETLGQRWNCCGVWNNCSKLTWCEDTCGQLHLHPSGPHASPTFQPTPWLLRLPTPSALIQLVLLFWGSVWAIGSCPYEF